MATALSKINSFSENLAEGIINLAGTPAVMLTNTAHTATWDELADLTPCVGIGNLSSTAIVVTTSAQTTGTYKLVLTDLTLTASGTVGPFQYVYVYDSESVGSKLCWYYDYGSAITMAATDTFKIDFDPTSGAITIA